MARDLKELNGTTRFMNKTIKMNVGENADDIVRSDERTKENQRRGPSLYVRA